MSSRTSNGGEKQYEATKDKGTSKQRAARIRPTSHAVWPSRPNPQEP